jgi:hypothetical protein
MGWTPIMNAAEKGNPTISMEMTKALIDSGRLAHLTEDGAEYVSDDERHEPRQLSPANKPANGGGPRRSQRPSAHRPNQNRLVDASEPGVCHPFSSAATLSLLSTL